MHLFFVKLDGVHPFLRQIGRYINLSSRIFNFNFFVFRFEFAVLLVKGYKIGCKTPFKYGKNTLKIVLILC